MQAYHNSQDIKDKYVERMKAHIAADELIRGEGFNDQGRGCAVGCTLNKYEHAAFEEELGIPEWLARVEESLFEGMSLEKSKTFPLVFLESIKVGADLDKIRVPFTIFVLESLYANFDHVEFPNVKKSIDDIIHLYKTIGLPDKSTVWAAARSAAEGAWVSAGVSAEGAWASAVAAAEGAWASAGVSAEASADALAVAAVGAVWAAARSAVEAAWAAAWSLLWLTAWSAAESARLAAESTYDKQADKLLELIGEQR